jgi:O-methyltransferase
LRAAEKHRRRPRLLSEGNPKAAPRRLEERLKKEARGERWNEWAAVQFSLGNLAEAERGFRCALDSAPRDTQATLNLGILLAQTGRTKEAIPFLKDAAPRLEEPQHTAVKQLLKECSAKLAVEALARFRNVLRDLPSEIHLSPPRELTGFPSSPPASPPPDSQAKAPFDFEQRDRWGAPSYDADCLSVWGKNVAFMHDLRFLDAYRAGINSGHIFTPPGEDLHIEWRVAVACWAAKHGSHLEGDFVECGTNTGIMSLAICCYLDFNSTGKRFFLFDTFNGIPPDQISPKERDREKENAYYCDCWATAARNFKPYPNVTLVRGRVPEILASADIARVCYLSIDMNIAYPERAAMEFFWDKLVTGAVVLFDDYDWIPYREQKLTLDEFAANHGVEILPLPTGQGLLIKPDGNTSRESRP